MQTSCRSEPAPSPSDNPIIRDSMSSSPLFSSRDLTQVSILPPNPAVLTRLDRLSRCPPSMTMRCVLRWFHPSYLVRLASVCLSASSPDRDLASLLQFAHFFSGRAEGTVSPFFPSLNRSPCDFLRVSLSSPGKLIISILQRIKCDSSLLFLSRR